MEEKEENNRIIAEFMGFEYNRSIPGHGGTVLMTLTIKDCRYHTSWDWLIPACKKFSELIGNGVDRTNFDDWNRHNNTIRRHLSDCNIEEAFLCLAEGILWYNKQTL